MINKSCYKFLTLLPFIAIFDAHAIGGIYGKVDVGFLMPQGKVGSKQNFYKLSDNKSFKNTLTYSAAVGVNVIGGLRTELMYSRVDNLRYKVDKVMRSKNTQFRQKVNIQSLMLNCYYDLPVPKFTPYFGVGLGISEINSKNAVIKAGNRKAVDKSEKSRGFSYSLMAGLSYQFNEKINLDFGYKFQDYGKNKGLKSNQLFKDGKSSDPRPLLDQKSFKMRAHTFSLGLRYTFSI